MGAFSRMFPDHFFEGFAFPFIEDIVNAAPSTCYEEWRAEQGLEDRPPFPPLSWEGMRPGGRGREEASSWVLSRPDRPARSW